MTTDHDWTGLNSVLVQRNFWLNQQLHAIGDLWGETDDADITPEQCGEFAMGQLRKLGEILRRKRPRHIGPAESCHVSFHWRDRDRPDGYSDALPGDGYGFAEAVEGFGLRMTFDCAGILACADLSFDALRVTLGKEGYGVTRLTELGLLSSDATVKAMAHRIATLELCVKSLEQANEHLTTQLYGADDEPTLELPPEALEKMAALVENPPKPSEALRAAAARHWKKQEGEPNG